ncbi:MAG: RNA polymerase sigma-54 factor, partial [Waddliaceae bacterium]
MFLDLRQKQSQSLKQLQRLIMSPQMQQAIHLMQIPSMELSEVLQEELEQNPVLELHEEDPDEEGKEVREDKETPPEEELTFDDDDFEIMKRLDEDFRDHFAESENYYTKRTAEEEKRKTFLEQSIPAQETLFEHLMRQAREVFEKPEEIKMAEAIIGNFDDGGFLHTPLKEIALLNSFREHRLKKILREIQKFDPNGVGASSLQESLLIQLRRCNLHETLAYKILEHYYEDLLNNQI